MKRTSTVLAFGTFDLLHPGHRSFLRQARALGTRLVVGISRDAVVKKLKGRFPVHSEQQRRKAVASLPYVSQALVASKDPRRRFAFIKKIHPNVIALGYDQTHYTTNLTRELKRHSINCRIIRLDPHRPHRYKTSLIRKGLAPLEAKKKKQR